MKKIVLYSIYALFLLTAQAFAQTNPKIDLTGKWVWADNTASLELNLYQQGNDITGTYCALAQNGNRIDCDTESNKCLISGTLIGNTAKIAFASCYSYRIDTAIITYNPNRKTLKWQWTQTSPDTYAPVPTEALLTEKGGNKVTPLPDLLRTAQTVVEIIKTQNFEALSKYFHPISGIRFSPYAYIDTLSDRVISSAEFTKALKQSKKIIWGAYEGSGEPIELDIKNYFNTFISIANADPSKKGINQEIGVSTTVSNITAIYPESDFIEYYYEKTDGKGELASWQSLRLLFKLYQGKYYLVGIVHDSVNE